MRFCPKCHSIYTAQVEHCGIDGARLAETDRDPLIGIDLDRYTVEERIGVGPNGAVYRVRHRFLGHGYAMKVLFGDLGANKRIVERFRREARAASLVVHPNVVSVTDFGTSANGLAFMVMDLLEGETLDRVLQRGPLPAARVASLVAQIAAGLGAAHDKGFVHRDIKPSNVMIRRDSDHEVAKILDFGVVGLAESASDPRLTGEGHFVGTPLYMAPEQARYPKRVRPSSDLYSLGVLTFQMLTGHPPYDADSVVDLMIKHTQDPIPPMPDAQGLELLVEWLMDKNPDRRPASARVVVEEVARLTFVRSDAALSSDRSETSTSSDTLEMGPEAASGELPLADLLAQHSPDFTPDPTTPLDPPAFAFGGAPPRSPSGLPGGADLSYDFLRGRLDALEAHIDDAEAPRLPPAWRLRVKEVRAALLPDLSSHQYDALAQQIELLEASLAPAGR